MKGKNMELKEEIRSRLNIEDVIGEYVHLKRAGRNFKGLSPFTQEKTPSFYVSPDKQIWHDFSASKGGDVFSFVMEVEGIDFRACLELLARKAGVDISQYQTKGDGTLAKKKQRLLSALDLAASYYQQSLVKNPTALEYVFKKRGFNKDAVGTFRIGYAPDNDTGLLKALEKRGFKAQELKDAGLVTPRRGRFTDMFRARMMVPLSDGQGQVVGFTARQLKDEPNSPKYINTPQTLLYDKGRQLFGLHLAKEAIRLNNKAVIVEGNLDVLSSWQHGVKNVVAAAGTALTEFHLKSLVRLTENVALAFDADKAGIAATERAIDIAQNLGIRLSVVVLPDDVKDPDELVQKDADAWAKAIEKSEPVVDWVIAQYQKHHDVKSVAGKRELTTRALGIINKLQDPVEREHYVQLLSKITDSSVEVLEEKRLSLLEKAVPQRRLKESKAKPTEPSIDALSAARQDALLALVATDIDVRDAVRDVGVEEVSGDERRAVLKYVKDHSQNALSDPVPQGLKKYDTYVKILLLQAEARYGNWNAQERYFEAAKLVRHLRTQKRTEQKQQLINELRTVERSGDTARAKDLRKQLNNLIKEQK